MGSKRGNGEGSIKKRDDGRWEGRIVLPNGKRRSFYGKTRQEIVRHLAAARRDIEQGIVNDGTERQIFAEYMQQWLDSTKHVVKPSTWKYYETYVRVHIVPHLGTLQLGKVTAQHIQRLYIDELEKGLSPTTVHHIDAILNRAFGNAVRLGLIPRNIVAQVDGPRMHHHEMATLSAENVRNLLAVVEGDRFQALYLLAITTGMRRGEILALHWKDVDLNEGVIQVRYTMQDVGGMLTFTEPKTEKSRRLVRLAQVVINALKEHKMRQMDEMHLIGEGWDSTYDLVFPNSVGRPMHPSNLLSRYFWPALDKAGLPHMRFHDLRHTAATLLFQAGIHPKIVSDMLGHADVSITLGIYSHVIPSMHQAAAAAMDDFFQLEEKQDGNELSDQFEDGIDK